MASVWVGPHRPTHATTRWTRACGTRGQTRWTTIVSRAPLDLPSDAQFVEGQWRHPIIFRGYVCAACYGENDHVEGPKRGTKVQVKLSEAEVLERWEHEQVGEARGRAAVHRQKVFEALAFDPTKAEQLLKAPKHDILKMSREMRLVTLSLKAFASVFSDDNGQQFLVQYMEYQALTERLLDKDRDRAKTLENMYKRKYWDMFKGELTDRYQGDPDVLQALKQLREWDDVKIRRSDGSPLMSLR